MREAGRDLARDEWTELVFEHTFTTSAGTLDYALPVSPEFDRVVPGTTFDLSTFEPMRGPMTWIATAITKADGINTAEIGRTWRLRMSATRQKRFTLTEDPNGAFTLSFYYATKQWVYDGSTGYRSDIAADTDQPLFDDYLFELESKWRVLRALGLPYGDEALSASQVRGERRGREAAQVINLSRPMFNDVRVWGFEP